MNLFNKLKLFTIGAFALSLFIGCGDSSSPTNDDSDDDQSSSSQIETSSSSSLDVPDSVYVMLSDVPSVMDFQKSPEEGLTEAYILSPSGFYSRYFINDSIDDLTFHAVGTYELKNGVATLTHGSGSGTSELLDLYIDNDPVLSFKEETGDLYADKGDGFFELNSRLLSTYGNIKDAEDIEGTYSRTSGDTIETFVFFQDYEMSHEYTIGDDKIYELGKYDTPYGLSGARLVYSVETVIAPNAYSYSPFSFSKISKELPNITITTNNVAREFEFVEETADKIDVDDLIGDWTLVDDGKTWILMIDENSIVFKVVSATGEKDYIDTGDSYTTYGNILAIELNQSCSSQTDFVSTWLGASTCLTKIISPITVDNDSLVIENDLFPSGTFTKSI